MCNKQQTFVPNTKECPLYNKNRWDYKNFTERAKQYFKISNEMIKNEEIYWNRRKEFIDKGFTGFWVVVENGEISEPSRNHPVGYAENDDAYVVVVGCEVIHE